MARTVKRFSYRRNLFHYEQSAERNTDGYLVNTTLPVKSIIRIHMHPAAGDVVKQLEEGHESSDFQTGYTANVVQVADPEAKIRGDVVEHNGKFYEAIMRGGWTSGSAGAVTWSQYHFARVLDRQLEAP